MKKDIIGYDPNIVEIANLGKVGNHEKVCRVQALYHSSDSN